MRTNKVSVWIAVFFAGVFSHPSESRPRLISPFASTVPEISIPNTHLVARGAGFLLRGMAPHTPKDIEELGKYGVTDVLIFRNDVAGEKGIQEELELFSRHGKATVVHQIPFRWKDAVGFSEACQQSVRALKLLRDIHKTNGRGLFFHCTVGEDRTGYLAGLYRVIFEKKVATDVFQNEMCEKGFAEGDPHKPKHVVDAIHSNITPLYFKMVSLFETGRLKAESLDESSCANEPKPVSQIPICKTSKSERVTSIETTDSLDQL